MHPEYTCNVKRSTCEYNRLQTDPSSNILVALIPITQSSELPDSQPLESEVMTSQQAMNTTSLSGKFISGSKRRLKCRLTIGRRHEISESQNS